MNAKLYSARAAAIIIILTATLPAFIINANASQNNKEIFGELKSRLAEFKKNEVLPSMTEWKGMLDKAMSPEDLAQLDKFREQAAVVREKIRKTNKDYFENKRKEDSTSDDAMLLAAAKNKKAIKEIAMQAVPLAKKYKQVLEEIGKLAKPKGVEWKSKTKSIYEEWKEQYRGELKDGMEEKAANMGRRMFGIIDNPEENGNKARVALRFMLWDGKGDPLSEQERNDNFLYNDNRSGASAESSDLVAIQPNQFPNPVSGSAVIKFNLPQAQKLSVLIIDNSGAVVGTIYNGSLSEGEHTVSFDSNNINGRNIAEGKYFYKIQGEKINYSGKLIVSR